MDEAKIRGVLFQTLYDRRNNADGWVPLSDIDFSGGEPVTAEMIDNAALFLADAGWIEWQLFVPQNFTVGIARITEEGIGVVESGMLRLMIPISFPDKNTFSGVEAKAEAGNFAVSGLDLIGGSTPGAFTAGSDTPGSGGFGRGAFGSGPFGGRPSGSFEGVEAKAVAGTLSPVVSSSGMGVEAVGQVGSFESSPPFSEPLDIFRGTAEVALTPLEQRLTGDPAGIREAARRLADAIAEQLSAMQASKPNDPDGLKRYNELEGFLVSTQTGLRQLADKLDEATSQGTTPDRILVGEAAKIAVRMRVAFATWLETNRESLPGYYVRLGLLATGIAFLKTMGWDDLIPMAILLYAVKELPNNKSPKKD